MPLLIHSQTSTVQPLRLGNGETISSHTLLGMWLLIHAGIKVKPCYAWFTPNSRGTWDWLTTKKWRGKVVCSSYVTHQKVISYSWILAITRAYSPLKLTSSTIAVNRHKRSWNLSSSLASDPTRSWILLWSQVFVVWSWFTRLSRMLFGTVVHRSYIGHSWNFYVMQTLAEWHR